MKQNIDAQKHVCNVVNVQNRIILCKLAMSKKKNNDAQKHVCSVMNVSVT